MIDAINIGRGQYLADDGEIYPIVSWFDVDGDDCDPADAVAAVAGTEGRWWAVDLREFGSAPL